VPEQPIIVSGTVEGAEAAKQYLVGYVDEKSLAMDNILAILGLRALYFCLAVLIVKFRLLKPALIIIHAFVGVKLLLMSVPPYLDVIGLAQQKSIKIDTMISLVIVLATLALATVLNVLFPAKLKA
jgi:predicted tellurium resistance membrane protein TerC